MRYTYRCAEGHVEQVEHPMGASGFELVCRNCGAPMQIVVGVPQIRVRHGMRGDMRDYREDLARFPNDPEALVDGPRALQRLMDKRKRQGWEIMPLSAAGTGEASVSGAEPSSEQILRKAYQEAVREVGPE